jgi:hypothetical protein
MSAEAHYALSMVHLGLTVASCAGMALCLLLIAWHHRP